MEIYKIEIYGEDENQIQRMEEVIAPIKDIQDYFLLFVLFHFL